MVDVKLRSVIRKIKTDQLYQHILKVSDTEFIAFGRAISFHKFNAISGHKLSTITITTGTYFYISYLSFSVEEYAVYYARGRFLWKIDLEKKQKQQIYEMPVLLDDI